MLMAKQHVHSRLPPNSKESEMMVLGSMLTNINSLNVTCDLLDESDFYYKEHQVIFSALKSLYKEDKPADVHIVSEELKKKNSLDLVGGTAYLTGLAQYAGTSAYVEEYAQLVREKSLLRKMIDAAKVTEKDALEEKEDVTSLLDHAQARFFQISHHSHGHTGATIKDLLSGLKAESGLPFLKELEERQQTFIEQGPDALKITGIPTFFSDLDKMLNGFTPSNLMILAARPAMGKSALAINLAENISFKNNMPVGVFSLEMSSEQLLHRMICSQAEIESEKILTGSLDGMEFQRVVGAVKTMQEHTVVIDDQPGLKITELRSRARRMKEAHHIGFLVIDYLQLLSGSGTTRSLENRQMEISEISRSLKTLARELNIPILCVAQLSRKVEERQGHRPMMSDLRESGCLAGETLIQDVITQTNYTIKELAEREHQIPIAIQAIDEKNRLGNHVMVKAFYSGKKRVYKLTTKEGFTIRASANHPFRMQDSWRALEDLQKGDQIAIIPKTEKTHSNVAVQQKVALAWDEITEITEQGIEDVYDATVFGVHNFAANGIIVHNSIEQDADIVMFLLRREYYDPYDKPGMAELIVAKNRHGAIGNIDLVYRKEYAQFKDYAPENEHVEENSSAFDVFSE